LIDSFLLSRHGQQCGRQSQPGRFLKALLIAYG
jgi:hypothetical protein